MSLAYTSSSRLVSDWAIRTAARVPARKLNSLCGGSTGGPQGVHRGSAGGQQGVHRGSTGGQQGVSRGSAGGGIVR
eukprot:3519436-Pyramimonas_sp.AAC.1